MEPDKYLPLQKLTHRKLGVVCVEGKVVTERVGRRTPPARGLDPGGGEREEGGEGVYAEKNPFQT